MPVRVIARPQDQPHAGGVEERDVAQVQHQLRAARERQREQALVRVVGAADVQLAGQAQHHLWSFELHPASLGPKVADSATRVLGYRA